MARKRCKGTPLKVFSGKEATLNRIILLILESKNMLAKYDVFLEIRNTKGFRHIDSKTVYRRMEALEKDLLIGRKGTRPAKIMGESAVYEVTLKGKAALRLDENSIETFLKTATNEQLTKFLDLF